MLDDTVDFNTYNQPFSSVHLIQSHGAVEAYPSGQRLRGDVHPEQVSSLPQGLTIINIYRRLRCSRLPQLSGMSLESKKKIYSYLRKDANSYCGYTRQIKR